MELVRSNRTEILADALAARVSERPLGPFAREAIVVQSRGMERWLTLALAERLGIWGHPYFPFPRAAVEQVLDALSEGRSNEARAYDPGRLKWTIAELLRESPPAELRAYLGTNVDADRALRLATSASKVFDGYQVYRPTLLKRWAKSQDADWQAELWRRVADRLGPYDLASRTAKAISALRSKNLSADLPFERLHLFSLETLPPLFLELFSTLSHTVPTTFYLLEPSSEYVSDVQPTPRFSAENSPANGEGHPLLTTLGKLARDFQQLLLSVSDHVELETDLFQAPSREDLLGSLQADILEFRSPPEPASRKVIEASDQSISVHACKGPMREVQILHDLIRASLEDDPSLRPEDVVVMTPDIETYAPAFRAVFGHDDPKPIPYEVHDRKARSDASFYDDFLSVLEALDSRFSVFDLVRLWDANSLRASFRFNQDERSRLSELLAASGVRWGVDAGHRQELGFPPEAVHTWEAGFGRLFLGFALTPDSGEVFEGVLPRGAPTLDDAELIARIARLGEILFELRRLIREPLVVGEWANLLERFSALLFEEDDGSGSGLRTLRAALMDLRELVKQSKYEGAIPLKTVRRELEVMLRDRALAVGFLRRGVTLTELVPLRSIPFRLVCLIGMSEEGFPRADDRPSFDRTRADPRPGDRNKRDDDRHSFLQAVLCARQKLIITYSAAASSSKALANPSTIVWELGESVRRYCQRADGVPLLDPIQHPLHPFDSRYFDGGELPQSSSSRYLEIARAVGGSSRPAPKVELLAEPETPPGPLSADELSTWLWDPTKTFIRRVLRARFGGSELYEPTSALTEIGRREEALLGDQMLRAALGDLAMEQYLDAAPEFPDGTWGALERKRLAREVGLIQGRFDALGPAPTSESRLVAAEIDGLRLEARIGSAGDETRVSKRFSKLGRRAVLSTWIEHLLLHASSDLPFTTHLVLRDSETRAKVLSFGPVDDAMHELRCLTGLYRQCLASPLPLFGRPSWLFVETRLQKGADQAFAAAHNALREQRKWNPYIDYALGPEDPFQDQDWRAAFERAALDVFGPLFQHRSET